MGIQSESRLATPLSCLQAVAQEWISQHESKAGYQLGFHAIPSMSHLHLHVISKVMYAASDYLTPV